MRKSQIPIHQTENNEDSQRHLQENAQSFSDQCLKVVELLNQGKRLTVLWAANSGIASLPRRIKDLRDGGFDIQDEWVKNEKGKRLYKEYFLIIKTRPTKKEVIEKAKKVIQDHPKWIQPNLL